MTNEQAHAYVRSELSKVAQTGRIGRKSWTRRKTVRMRKEANRLRRSLHIRAAMLEG